MDAQKLTVKQARFVAEYRIDGNATRAAIAAGYARASAHVTGCELLKNTKIALMLKECETKVLDQLNLKADDVVKLLWNQATANPNELIEIRRGACRYCYGDNHLYQRTPAEYERDLAQYLTSNRLAARKGLAPLDEAGVDFPMMGGIGFRKKREPHPDCPECEGEGVMYEYVKDTRKLSPAGLALFAGVKITKDGVELKTNSQDKARELIGRHKGLFADLMKSDEDTPAPVGITFEVKSARKPE